MPSTGLYLTEVLMSKGYYKIATGDNDNFHDLPARA